jgi:rhodanese-related sulfurtransferase
MVNTIFTEHVQMMVECSDALVLGVMDRGEFERHHIPGTKNVPLSDTDFARRVGELAQHRYTPIVVYGLDAGSSDARAAAQVLSDMGFRQVYRYDGGMEVWTRVGKDLEGADSATKKIIH